MRTDLTSLGPRDGETVPFVGLAFVVGVFWTAPLFVIMHLLPISRPLSQGVTALVLLVVGELLLIRFVSAESTARQGAFLLGLPVALATVVGGSYRIANGAEIDALAIMVGIATAGAALATGLWQQLPKDESLYSSVPALWTYVLGGIGAVLIVCQVAAASMPVWDGIQWLDGLFLFTLGVGGIHDAMLKYHWLRWFFIGPDRD